MISKNTWMKWAAGLGLGLAVASAQADKPRGDKSPMGHIENGLSVLVLGSGGPVATPAGRASAGYLIFVDGKPRILMDAGGGTFQRLAASGVNIKDLDVVLLSHLHIDHTSDLSAIIKTVYFHNRGAGSFRTAPIRIYGPDANGVPFPGKVFPEGNVPQYPGTGEYVHGHYDLKTGLERYLHIFSRAISGGKFAFTVKDVPPDLAKPTQRVLMDDDGLSVSAIAVNHGPVPALAYRIDYKGRSVVYSGDTNSKTDNLANLAKGTDLLIYDTAIMDDKPNGAKDKVFYALHTTPTRMGQVAAKAGAKTLVLSHITPVTGAHLDEVAKLVRAQGYKGTIRNAEDLAIYNLGD